MSREVIMFRFVPTMRCNFRCEYCFVDNEIKTSGKTMFDDHSVQEWLDAFAEFEKYEIEPYFWGGEPFCIDDTYEFINGLTKYDNVVNGFRIDTNASFAEKIIEKCKSEKIKLNCSYHMQYHTLDEELKKIQLLRDNNMMGMVNFVASEYNLVHLKNDYKMTVKDLIKCFADIGVFLNVAGDFAYANNPKYERYEEYKNFIIQFISPEEWGWLRGENKEPRECSAGMKMFTVNMDGNFSSCIGNKDYGNYFEGVLKPDEEVSLCGKNCPSLISYPFRTDNAFPSTNSLLAYIKRNEQYRINRKEEYVDFVF